MKKLTTEQILATLSLSEIYPSEISWTQVENFNGRQMITVHSKADADRKQIEECIKTVFPSAKFSKYVTSDSAFNVMLKGQAIGSLHMWAKKETPAPTEVPQEIIQNQFITDGEVVANG